MVSISVSILWSGLGGLEGTRSEKINIGDRD